MMKNIWIDGYEANVKQRLGSSQVAFELIRNIEKIDQENEYTVLLPQEPLSDLPKERKKFKYKILKPKSFWTRVALPIALYTTKDKPDLIFSPTHYIPRFSPVKRVVTIFDLSYLHFPQMFEKKDLWQLTNWSKFSILNSDHIITISKFSREDIVKNYKIEKNKITVAYPGFGESFYKPLKDKYLIEQTKIKYGITGSYIIFVGTIQPRKNLNLLIEVFQKIENLKLVIVGKYSGEGRQAWKTHEILIKPHKLGIEDKVIFTNYVPEQDLVKLLNGAEAFVLPSLWEGFGIPVVDAMACGIPVIVSNVSSLPEVVGEAGLLIDPKKPDQLEQAIRTLVTDKKLRMKLSKKSLEQAKKYSWKKMAKEVIKVLELTDA